MNFLVDAQLPRRLVHHLRESGHDATHTLDLPSGNRTTDEEIIRLATAQDRVVITKDSDFVSSFMVHSLPRKLLLVSSGNSGNSELEVLFTANLSRIVQAFGTADFVELTRSSIVIHA